jgi:HPt (histidine-containing phosphotransfer) domain-containing protein
LSNTDAEVASGPAGGRRETDQSIDVEVDTATMDRLAEELGDREIVEQLVDVFLAELDGRIETITTSSGDDEVSGRAAHTLKSSARLLGATSLADACQAIELGESVDVDLPVIAGATRIRLAAWRQAEEPTDRAVRGDR